MDFRELEEQAREQLGLLAYDYFAGGADDEVTLADNLAAWGRLRLRPHVLRDVSAVSTATRVLGTPIASPVLVAPMAYQRLAHDDGERAMAQAAAKTQTIMVTSTLSTVALEEVADAAPGAPRWFQLYVHRDRGFTADLVARAVAASYQALVLTVDFPVAGFRRRDERNRFRLPAGLEAAHALTQTVADEGSSLAAYASQEMDPGLTFDDIGWLTGLSERPVVVKGVLRGDDARRCIDAGAAAIVVSNHGGRQLDGALASAEALPEVAAAVDGRAEVLVDGGVRRGTDVVKALALGAQAVLVGRPLLWGLAVDGINGVAAVLDALREDLARALALCGCPGVGSVTNDLVAPVDGRTSSYS